MEKQLHLHHNERRLGLIIKKAAKNVSHDTSKNQPIIDIILLNDRYQKQLDILKRTSL